jgi:hypothetical protein
MTAPTGALSQPNGSASVALWPMPTSAHRPVGCIWHGCPEHGTQPATNEVCWTQKIAANDDRDLFATTALEGNADRGAPLG